MKSSEDVLLSLKHVKHKYVEGILDITSTRIAWTTQTADSYKVSIPYSEIKSQRISPETKEKVQLQLVLFSGTQETFHFASPSGRSKQLEERDHVKDILIQLLPKSKQKISNEFEGKTDLLKQNPELFQLYKDLVVSGIMTPNEFWENHTSQSKEIEASLKTQPLGISADFLAEIRPIADASSGGFKYNLTADVILSIFKTYPAVKSKHQELVPHQISEQEFWLKFFQSHYFHRDKLHIAKDDLFAECVTKDESLVLESLSEVTSDVFLNIARHSDVDDIDPEEFQSSSGIQVPNKQSILANRQLIKRCNQHSLMILRSDGRSSAGPETSANGLGEKGEIPDPKKQKRSEMIRLDDLLEDDTEKGDDLVLDKTERYMYGPAAVAKTQFNLTKEQLEASVSLALSQFDTWNDLSLCDAMNEDIALEALRDTSAGGCLSSIKATSQTSATTRDSDSETKQTFKSLQELLRHFWACFPVTSPQLEEKLQRMHQTLRKFDAEKVQPLQGDSSNSDIAIQFSELLKTAYTKYDTWSFRKKR